MLADLGVFAAGPSYSASSSPVSLDNSTSEGIISWGVASYSLGLAHVPLFADPVTRSLMWTFELANVTPHDRGIQQNCPLPHLEVKMLTHPLGVRQQIQGHFAEGSRARRRRRCPPLRKIRSPTLCFTHPAKPKKVGSRGHHDRQSLMVITMVPVTCAGPHHESEQSGRGASACSSREQPVQRAPRASR